MSLDRAALLAAIRDLPGATAAGSPGAAAIAVPALVDGWLTVGSVLEGEDGARLDALCRQIDVRKRICAAYGPGFTRAEPELPAPARTVSGLVAVLLVNAAAVGAVPTGDDHGADAAGWGLKCVNSALKALDLHPDVPHAPALRAWALEVLDRVPAAGVQP